MIIALIRPADANAVVGCRHCPYAPGQNSGQNSCKPAENLENMQIESSNVTRDLGFTNHVRDVEVAGSNPVAPTSEILAGLPFTPSNSRALDIARPIPSRGRLITV